MHIQVGMALFGKKLDGSGVDDDSTRQDFTFGLMAGQPDA
jgi:hypothetical protein